MVTRRTDEATYRKLERVERDEPEPSVTFHLHDDRAVHPNAIEQPPEPIDAAHGEPVNGVNDITGSQGHIVPEGPLITSRDIHA